MKTSAAAERPPAEGLVRALRQALRGAPAMAREAGFPRAWWRHLGEQGLLGLSFDLDGQGPRADWPTIARLAGCMARETGRLGLTLGWMLNEMLGRCVIGGAGIESERVRALLRRMAAGQAIVGLAVSEPDAGAHPKRLRCSARREQDAQGERWLIDGIKSHVSNGPAADAFVVLAVTADDGQRKAFVDQHLFPTARTLIDASAPEDEAQDEDRHRRQRQCRRGQQQSEVAQPAHPALRRFRRQASP